MGSHLDIPRERVAAFCRRRQIVELSLFGSVLRDDFGADSDVDVLVRFDPGARVGLLDMAGMESELAGILGRRVDLRTPAELSRYFRGRVLAEAEPQYAR